MLNKHFRFEIYDDMIVQTKANREKKNIGKRVKKIKDFTWRYATLCLEIGELIDMELLANYCPWIYMSDKENFIIMEMENYIFRRERDRADYTNCICIIRQLHKVFEVWCKTISAY